MKMMHSEIQKQKILISKFDFNVSFLLIDSELFWNYI